MANTWTKVVITIPGDTAGTWVLNGNLPSCASLLISILSRRDVARSAGAWASGTHYVGANGTVSVVATNAANFLLTGVKLEIGSVATPYNRQSLTKSLADCQRYFQTSYINVPVGSVNPNGILAYALGSAPAGVYWINAPITIPAMRVSPTATGYSPTTGAAGKARDINANADVTCAWSAGGLTSQTVYINNSASAGGYNFQFHYTFSAEL